MVDYGYEIYDTCRVYATIAQLNETVQIGLPGGVILRMKSMFSYYLKLHSLLTNLITTQSRVLSNLAAAKNEMFRKHLTIE